MDSFNQDSKSGVLQPIGASPTPPNVRYDIIDIVRGFALLGVLLANINWVNNMFTPETAEALPTSTIDSIFSSLIWVLVDYKFYTIFTILFGLGFAMQISRAAEKQQPIMPVYSRRLFILLLIGIAHTFLLWYGDILHVYALLGFTLILFHKKSDKVLLIWILIAAVITALMPFIHWKTTVAGFIEMPSESRTIQYSELSSGTWSDIININLVFNLSEYSDLTLKFDGTSYWYLSVFWKFLLGYLIGRHMFLQKPERYLTSYRKMLPWTLLIGLAGNAFWVVYGRITDQWIPETHSATSLIWVLVEISILSLSIAYIAGVVLLFQKPSWKNKLNLLAPVGRMALTNYLTQSFFIILIFYDLGWGLSGKVGSVVCLLLAIILFALQTALSIWWLKRFRFGPVEWAWRSLTYGKRQPLRLPGYKLF